MPYSWVTPMSMACVSP